MGSPSTACARPSLRGDESELFRRHHRRLLRLIARDVDAPPQVIEDACAYAWLELVARQPARTNIVGWLRIVARHKAIRLAQYDRRLSALVPERAGYDPGLAPPSGRRHATRSRTWPAFRRASVPC